MSHEIPPDYEEFEPSWDPSLLAASCVGLLAMVGFAGSVLPALALLEQGDILVAFGLILAGSLLLVLHECVHALVGWWYDCTVSFGIDIEWLGPMPYVVTGERFVTRAQRALIAIAPLVSLTLLGLCGLVLVGPLTNLGLGLATILSINIMASTNAIGSDVNNAYRCCKLPPGTRIKDSSDGTIFIRPKTPDE